MENEIMSADYSRAVKLNQSIKVHAELAQQSLYEMCKGLKEMRDDKLYKELGYENFASYCEKEVGITSRQTYKFISITENLSEDFVNSSSQIGVTKLALLAKLDEPEREEIVQNVDLESTSVKQLREKIHQLTIEKSNAEDKMLSLEERCERLDEEKRELTETLNEAKDTQKNLVGQIESLEDTIQELENRPVDVEYSDNSEEIMELKMQLKLKESEIEDVKVEKETAIDNIKAGYEMKISQLQNSQADKPENSDVLAEINAYKKVADESLHNLYIAIVRQQKYSSRRFKANIDELLSDWTARFNELCDDND